MNYKMKKIGEMTKILDNVNDMRQKGMSYKDIAPKLNLTVN